MAKEYLIDRVQELNAFFQYIIRSPEVFNIEPVRKFFDPNLTSKDLQVHLTKIIRPPVEELIKQYEILFPESAGKTIDMERRTNLIRFKEKVDVNIEFYKKFKDISSDLASKTSANVNSISDDEKTFYEMLMVAFANDETKTEQLREDLQKIQEYDSSTGYKLWELKLQMVIAELESFREVYKDLQATEQLYDKRLRMLSATNQEIDKINKLDASQNPDQRQRLTVLRTEIETHDVKGKASLALMGLLMHRIVAHDIEYVKARKRERVKEIINLYAGMHTNHLQNSINFWTKAADFSAARVSNLDSTIIKQSIVHPIPAEIKESKEQPL